MGEQQPRNDAPKIVVLVVGLVAVFAFIFWRVMSTSFAKPPGPANTTPATTAAGGPTTTGIQSSDAVATATTPGTPGVIRNTNTALDNGGITVPPQSPPKNDPSRPFSAPQKDMAIAEKGQWNSGGAEKIPPTPPAPKQVVILSPPVTHFAPVKVEGVVLGSHGFALITFSGDMLFRGVGESPAPGYRIAGFKEDGVVVRYTHRIVRNNHYATATDRAVWPIGGRTLIEQPGFAAAGASAPQARPVVQMGGMPAPQMEAVASATPSTGDPAPNGSAPSFTQTTRNGETVSFPGDYHGKVVLLDFWATWCPPCRQEIPKVVTAYKRLHSEGFEILGVSLDHENQGQNLTSFLGEHGMSWKQIYGASITNQIADLYHVTGIPYEVLVDGSTGQILAQGYGLGDELAPKVEEALRNRKQVSSR